MSLINEKEKYQNNFFSIATLSLFTFLHLFSNIHIVLILFVVFSMCIIPRIDQ